MEKQPTEFELNKRSKRVFYLLIIFFLVLFSPAFYMMAINNGVPANADVERAINSLGKLNDFDTLVDAPVNEKPIE